MTVNDYMVNLLTGIIYLDSYISSEMLEFLGCALGYIIQVEYSIKNYRLDEWSIRDYAL